MSIRDKIRQRLVETVEEQTGSRMRTEVTDDLDLLRLRIDSVGFAILLSRLEDDLGLNPLTAMEEPILPRTFGEFVALFEEHAGK